MGERSRSGNWAPTVVHNPGAGPGAPCQVSAWGPEARGTVPGACVGPDDPSKVERPADVLAGRSLSGGRRYTSGLASLLVLGCCRPDLLGQSRPSCLGDCWTRSTDGEPPLESGDPPELLNALVANNTTASPASTVATRMARHGRHPVRAVVTGSSGKRASFSRRP